MGDGRLISSDTSQAQTEDFELAYPTIYPIYDLPERLKGLVLHIHDTGSS